MGRAGGSVGVGRDVAVLGVDPRGDFLVVLGSESMDIVFGLGFAGLFVFGGYKLYDKGGLWRVVLGSVLVGVGFVGAASILFG